MTNEIALNAQIADKIKNKNWNDISVLLDADETFIPDIETLHQLFQSQIDSENTSLKLIKSLTRLSKNSDLPLQQDVNKLLLALANTRSIFKVEEVESLLTIKDKNQADVATLDLALIKMVQFGKVDSLARIFTVQPNFSKEGINKALMHAASQIILEGIYCELHWKTTELLIIQKMEQFNLATLEEALDCVVLYGKVELFTQIINMPNCGLNLSHISKAISNCKLSILNTAEQEKMTELFFKKLSLNKEIPNTGDMSKILEHVVASRKVNLLSQFVNLYESTTDLKFSFIRSQIEKIKLLAETPNQIDILILLSKLADKAIDKNAILEAEAKKRVADLEQAAAKERMLAEAKKEEEKRSAANKAELERLSEIRQAALQEKIEAAKKEKMEKRAAEENLAKQKVAEAEQKEKFYKELKEEILNPNYEFHALLERIITRVSNSKKKWDLVLSLLETKAQPETYNAKLIQQLWHESIQSSRLDVMKKLVKIPIITNKETSIVLNKIAREDNPFFCSQDSMWELVSCLIQLPASSKPESDALARIFNKILKFQKIDLIRDFPYVNLPKLYINFFLEHIDSSIDSHMPTASPEKKKEIIELIKTSCAFLKENNNSKESQLLVPKSQAQQSEDQQGSPSKTIIKLEETKPQAPPLPIQKSVLISREQQIETRKKKSLTKKESNKDASKLRSVDNYPIIDTRPKHPSLSKASMDQADKLLDQGLGINGQNTQVTDNGVERQVDAPVNEQIVNTNPQPNPIGPKDTQEENCHTSQLTQEKDAIEQEGSESTKLPIQSLTSKEQLSIKRNHLKENCIKEMNKILEQLKINIKNPAYSYQIQEKALGLLATLENNKKEYAENLINLEMSIEDSNQKFKNQCVEAINNGKKDWGKALGWGDYLTNLLKSLLNAMIKLFSKNRSRLFTIAKPSADLIPLFEQANIGMENSSRCCIS